MFTHDSRLVRKTLVALVIGAGAFAQEQTVDTSSVATESVADQAGAVPADTVTIGGARVAVADITRSDVLGMKYTELVDLPFEVLVGLADKLEISVEELLNMKMTVSSKAAMTIREQPGIMSVITHEDIRKSGARDLMDVLRLVPGAFFGLDVNGVVGIGVRGLWAHEGKVLVLVDGQEMNDLDYFIFPYGGHLCPDQIERIEIVRGPGSSLYGGAAELGVINIVTRQGADIGGVEGAVSLGRNEDMMGQVVREAGESGGANWWDIGRGQVYLGIGKRSGELEFNLTGAIGTALRSDKTLESFYLDDATGEPLVDDLEQTGRGQVTMGAVNAGIRWKDFSTRFIYDYYKTWGIDSWVYDNSYKHFMGELRYDWKLLDGALTLTPKFNFRKLYSWFSVLSTSQRDYLRLNASVQGVWDVTDWLNISGGADYYHDYFTFLLHDKGLVYYGALPLDSNGAVIDSLVEPLDNYFSTTGDTETRFDNIAVYLQGLVKTRHVNVTLGGRFEHNSVFGSAFAPRAGVTGLFGDFHAKLLFSKAFRSPSIGALDLLLYEGDDLKPEATYVTELELGYQFNKFLFATVNLFDMTVVDPIYYFDFGDTWGYLNADITTGSDGIEAEVSMKHKRITASLNYSYYTSVLHDVPELTEVDADGNDVVVAPFSVGDPDAAHAYIAAPQHKVALMCYANVWRGLTVAPSFTLVSSTYGYTSFGIDSTADIDSSVVPADTTYSSYTYQVEGKVKPTFTMNLVLSYDFKSGVSVSAGVYDLFNQQYPYLQAYNGLGAPVEGLGREWSLKVNWLIRARE